MVICMHICCCGATNVGHIYMCVFQICKCREQPKTNKKEISTGPLPCICARQRTFGPFADRSCTAKTTQGATFCASWRRRGGAGEAFAVPPLAWHTAKECLTGARGCTAERNRTAERNAHGEAVRTAARRAHGNGERTAATPRLTAKLRLTAARRASRQSPVHGSKAFAVHIPIDARQRSFAGRIVAVRSLPTADARRLLFSTVCACAACFGS